MTVTSAPILGRAIRPCLVVAALWLTAPSGLTAQRRQADAGPVPVVLRAKPHEATYFGVLEVVGKVGGREQYRVGPDTIILGVDVRQNTDGVFSAQYMLNLGEGEPTVGNVAFSQLGIDASSLWRPALEALTVTPFLPLAEAGKLPGEEWGALVSYRLADLALDFAEATRFWIKSVDGERVTIGYSAEGGGSGTVARPQLGTGATMDIDRQSAREGHFVFDMVLGRVIESERLERITTESVFHGADGSQDGPKEEQMLTFKLIPSTVH